MPRLSHPPHLSPATCLTWPLQVSSLLMLYPLANLANLLMWGLTFLGATWAYAKYRCDQDFFTFPTRFVYIYTYIYT